MGESLNFHLIYGQRFAQVNVSVLRPSDVQKLIFILEVHPVLDATEFAMVIVIQYRGDFCGTKIRSFQVPISRSSKLVTRSAMGGTTYFVTNWV